MWRTLRLPLIFGILSVTLLFGGRPTSQAQVGGVAEITAPLPGVPLVGQVTITGSASHPAFIRYTLDFAYDPNPTNSWFPLPVPAASPVTNGPLAVWNTDPITPGQYMLRLQVFASDGSAPTETVLTGIVVADLESLAEATEAAQPQITPTSAVVLPPTATPQPATPTPEVSPTPDILAPPSTEGGNPLLVPFLASFWQGVTWAIVFFSLLAAYLVGYRYLRGPIRKWLRRTLSDLRRP